MYQTAKRMKKRRHRRGYLAAAGLAALAVWMALSGICIVTDGGNVYPCYALFASAAGISERVGIVLDPLDRLEKTHRFGVTCLTVIRAPRVSVRYHGTEITAATFGETAAQLLKRLDRIPGEGDVVSLPGDTRLRDGMTLCVDLVTRTNETYTAVLPSRTEYREDPSAPWGQETVLIPGSDGETLVTAEVEYTNGRETARTVLRREEVIPAVDRVVAVGTSQTEVSPGPEIHYNYLTLPDGGMLTFTGTAVVEATAYTGTDAGCNMVTASGTTVHRGTVCVDPNFIPYGTRMYIMTSDGSFLYGIAQAEDCRPGIEGWRVDLYLPTPGEAAQFGRQKCTVFFLG